MAMSDAILTRLLTLHPKIIDLDLDAHAAHPRALGHPETHLPPVIHIAGTNGKGSTLAYLRACLEAAGLEGPLLYLAASCEISRAHSRRRRTHFAKTSLAGCSRNAK